MKAQGSRDDPKLHTRPPLARDGAKTGYSCTCIKTTPKSGQARRGLDRALAVGGGLGGGGMHRLGACRGGRGQGQGGGAGGRRSPAGRRRRVAPSASAYRQ